MREYDISLIIKDWKKKFKNLKIFFKTKFI